MNFEDNETVIRTYDLVHDLGLVINTDSSCIRCYPPPRIHETDQPYKYFWNWFQKEFRANVFSAYTVVTFKLIERIYDTPDSAYRTNRIAELILKLLHSIRYRARPVSFEIKFYYFQGLIDLTYCFTERVKLSTSIQVYNSIIDRKLLSIQEYIDTVEQILSLPTPTASSLPSSEYTTPLETPPKVAT